MRKITIFLLVALSFLKLSAQSADQMVAQMMNQRRWFDLREYYQTKIDSIEPFLDTFARAMIANFFNQNLQAANLCQDLLNSQQLDLGNVLSVGSLLCNNLNRIGENEKSLKVIEAIESSISPYFNQLDSATVSDVKTLIALNKAKSSYRLDQVEPFPENISVPFSLNPIGPEKHRSVTLDVEGEINGNPCTMVFDTGAGTNVISDSLAAAMNLDIVDLDLSLSGVGSQSARFAVAKELNLGQLKISNVPFFVTTLKTGHQEADQYMSHFQIVIGRDIMEAVKYISFDFENKVLTFMPETDIPQEAQTNLCIGPDEVYMLQCYICNRKKVYLNPDTGDSSYGRLFSNILSRIQDNVELEPVQEKLRLGGAGGYAEVAYDEVKDLPLTIEDTTTIIPRIPILLEEAPDLAGYDGVIGIETFKLLGKVSFDLERMILYPSR